MARHVFRSNRGCNIVSRFQWSAYSRELCWKCAAFPQTQFRNGDEKVESVRMPLTNRSQFLYEGPGPNPPRKHARRVSGNHYSSGRAVQSMERCSMKRKSTGCGIPSLADFGRTRILEAWSKSAVRNSETCDAKRNRDGPKSYFAAFDDKVCSKNKEQGNGYPDGIAHY
jgi:hypothetical protein